MMPFHTYEFGRSRMREAERQAAKRRLVREATMSPSRPAASVADAVGHGLIAIGARLVTDPHSHPTHSRAA